MKKVLAVTTMSLMVLTGCGDSFTGTYKFDNSPETMTIKSDGTCEDDLGGVKTACEWKRVGEGVYEIQMKTFLGNVSLTAKKSGTNAYDISAYGKTITMRK